jgi:class 3 adenylate cyclase/DNA-binding CsgD family transcriptional regulator
MAPVAEVEYARSGDVHLAYQVTGTGALDLLLLPDGLIPIESMAEEPSLAHFLDRLAAVGRLIRFDRRGIGLSDPVSPQSPPTLEQWMDDALAVLRAAASESAVVVGLAEGGFVATLLAASHPDVASRLVLINATPVLHAAPFNRWGQAARKIEELIGSIETGWGGDVSGIEWFAPSAAGDPRYRRWLAQALRRAVSPATARALCDVMFWTDVRSILPTVRVPTLVIHRAGNRYLTPEHGRYLSEHICGAKYVEVSGDDHVPYLGDSEAVIGEIEEFVTGSRRSGESESLLLTVLFCDIVASTERAAALGDRRWHSFIDDFQRAVRDELERFRGREVKTLGDGFLAIFDGPARSIRCAAAICDAAAAIGIGVRAGLHTGECHVDDGGDIRGLTVHIAARVAARAASGEVLVSRTVRDLVAGSGITLVDRGVHVLRGVPDEWRLFAVESLAAAVVAAPAAASAGRRRTASSDRPGRLSERELEVAGFVAEGLSNAQIGLRLCVSARTVENHVGHILTKLDLRNRAEIARWAAQTGIATPP